MIIVIDLGSQTAHLISRRIRDLGVNSKLVSRKITAATLNQEENLQGIILSGGPDATYEAGSIAIDKKIFDLKVPVLGICYGMQLMARLLGGKVILGSEKEFGGVTVKLKMHKLFSGLQSEQKVWMSHTDQVAVLPKGFKNFGFTKATKNIAMADDKKQFLGIQFHPEVAHTSGGNQILNNFIFKICKVKKTLNKNIWLNNQIQLIKDKTGKDTVICGLSGGVDSATAAVIVYRAVGNNLRCVYVDTGLMRTGETEQIQKDFRKIFGRSLVVIKAEKLFLSGLKGIEDPEQKRKIIGKLFIDIFEKEAKKFKAKWLVQGTIYPDVIESAKKPSGEGKHDSAHLIKSHHNVGGLPEKMQLKLIEPLRNLYKDEVRELATKLGLPKTLINRQPFPGPGLAVRIRGEVTRERLNRLRQAEQILQEECKKIKLPEGIWVTQAIYVPLKTTGVKGDFRAFEEMIAIRSLTSKDAMTADWTRLPYELLAKVSARIVGEVEGINRVVYDITTKPPATMEWE